jgi:hypothetical protein
VAIDISRINHLPIRLPSLCVAVDSLLRSTKNAFNTHSQPHPPQTSAASCKRPYRNCPGLGLFRQISPTRLPGQSRYGTTVSRERLNAYERGLGEQYSLHASDPHMGWDDSGTKALVGSQFVLARDVEFSCAASLTFVSWNGSARGSL